MSEKENKSKKLVLPVSLSIVFLVIGFGLGIVYQKNKLKTTFTNRMGQFPMGEGMGRGTGRNNQNGDIAKNRGQVPEFRQTFGEIINVDDKTITIKMADGSSKIVLISDSTKINQSVTASKTDLVIGTKIMVNGDTNTDGSISSRNIEINPAFASLTITPTVKQ